MMTATIHRRLSIFRDSQRGKERPARNVVERRRWRLWLTLGLLAPLTSIAGSITTPGIVTATAGAIPACLQWAIIGACVWLNCTPFGCTIKTSAMVGHYNPDLVVSAYHRTGDSPWVEMATLYGGLQKTLGQTLVSGLMDVAIGEGDRANDKFHRSHKDLIFKEADAIGHPLQSVLGHLPKGLEPTGSIPGAYRNRISAADAVEILCPSETLPFTPYLLSTADLIAWRFGLPETVYPQALIPGLRELGHWPLNTWGAVYPRSGFVTQAEDPKAGAVVAQRAGDIVTRLGQPHVYQPTGIPVPHKRSGFWVWPPGPLREVDHRTGYWQMLTPRPEDRCAVFGQNDTKTPVSWADGKVDPAGDYAWNLWRPYRCCPVRGQTLLSIVQWMPWPP